MSGFAMEMLEPGLEEQLRRHAESAYPNEACGALIGTGDGSGVPWSVVRVLPAPNEHQDDRKRRYLVPPDFQLKAEHAARGLNLDVVGYYHSHPDHPPFPSEYDRVHAWLGYLYVICSVQKGRFAELRAFSLEFQEGPFAQVVVGSRLNPRD